MVNTNTVRRHALVVAAFSLILSASPFAQSPSSDASSDGSSPRIFGIIPNYRTSPTLTNYEPLSPETKLHLAAEDAFDRGTFVLAGLFAAQSQWTQAAPSF